MNRVLESRKISPQTVAAVGIAIHRVGLHVGVLYRVTKSDSVRILHLGQHEGLASEEPTDSYVCWVRPSLGLDRAMAVAALCRRIWKQNQDGKIPYGFSTPSAFFDASGRKLKSPATVGLTCASFVLAVFAAASIPLIRPETWPVPTREDVVRQRKLLEVQIVRMGAGHAQRVRAEIGNIRFHPLEVAGAATAEILPADYAYSSLLGKEINKLLTFIRSKSETPPATERRRDE
jgi:hypothetical protein